MERRIDEAAVEGSVISLLNLLQEDALVLDRFMVGCYPETPLHAASMLGHAEFVQEFLSRKPELTRELDSRKSSPLHLATAKEYLDIVKKLVFVKPELCLVGDRDGRNPLHIAAIKGHVNVLRELVRIRPQAARILTDRGETILHVCVNYSQLETMKFLIQTDIVSCDHEFVNCKDEDGNILAVIDKQVEAIKFLTAGTKIEVNAVNGNGFTALDILTQSKRAVKDWEIGELLRDAGAITDNGRGTTQTGTSILKPEGKGRKYVPKKQDDWLTEMRSALMVVASLIAPWHSKLL